ncbi:MULTISPECIES: hypothetical protein [Candidatus Nitrosotenuis]|uniref:hypothetical protein n=1 Tax=Candidatus Nitrosotenuis TaxID=1825023 RepID=UPI0005B2CB80|nr:MULTISPECIES: hypothetical protein [Nitrosotenuis]QLH09620.1 hypothetical protein DSQ19_09225 [Candidatus Nitrosotenuis sp. DW1]
MRIDLCRKCGYEMKKYEQVESCQSCGKDFEQFVCLKCSFVTEPQYHIHQVKLEAMALRP